MQITQETLHKIADLARLEIKPEEEAALLNGLDEVLNWMDQLKEVNTDGVEPLTHISGEVNVWREDKSEPTITRDQAFASSPSHTGQYFKVPKVLE